MKIILKLLVIFLPWKLKRLCLNYFWKYQIHPKAHIGFSFIYPKKLIMEEGAQMGISMLLYTLNRFRWEKTL